MNMMTEVYDYKNMSTSAQLLERPGYLKGIFVSAASAVPTIKVWDSTAASGAVVVGTFTPVAATYYEMPAALGTGLYITISGTVDCTVFYK